MIALVFVALVVAGIWLGIRSARSRRAPSITWTAEPSTRLRLRSARKGERL